MDYGAYSAPPGQKDFEFLQTDDTAIPPVVRTAKPPSGFSPLTAPKRSSWSNGTSLHKGSPLGSSKIEGVLSSIGSLSIEPGPRYSSASINSPKSGSKSSLKSPRRLVFHSSNEKIREMDRDRKRKPNRAADTSKLSGASTGINATTATNDSLNSPDYGHVRAIVDPRVTLETPRESLQLNATETSVDGSMKAATIQKSTIGVGGDHSIPDRDSSLRHSFGSPPRSKRQSSGSHGISIGHGPKQIEQPQGQDDSRTRDAQKVSDEPAENEVSRRIRELKAQKEMRDRSHKVEKPTRDPEEQDETSIGRRLLAFPSAKNDDTTRSTGAPLAEVTNGQTRPTEPMLRQISPSCGKIDIPSRSGSRSIPSTRVKSKMNRSGSKRSSLSQRKREPRPKGTAPLESHKRTFSNSLSQAGRTSTYDDRPSTADSIDDALEYYLCSARLSQKISHPQTGRVISFSEVGDPDGSVVFCCVGMGMTRFLTAFYDELALTLKLRLITPDRPGIGESEPYADGSDTPLGWPGEPNLLPGPIKRMTDIFIADDVRAICHHLRIPRFSLLAHSAGAIYALATALRMPQHIRGRIHILAPFIPPSQMSVIGNQQQDSPATALPYSQRFLRSLPTPFLKAANSNFFTLTSSSIGTILPKSPRRSKRKSLAQEAAESSTTPAPDNASRQRDSMSPGRLADDMRASPVPRSRTRSPEPPRSLAASAAKERLVDDGRQSEYDARLTHAIWNLATTNANPAVDLLVCLERRQDIGFRYVDIAKSVVIHHGSRDSRVPVENVKWLGKTMRNCEVRVLEGEGHGLMASAQVMGNVLMEMAKEWEDWNLLVQGKRKEKEGTAKA